MYINKANGLKARNKNSSYCRSNSNLLMILGVLFMECVSVIQINDKQIKFCDVKWLQLWNDIIYTTEDIIIRENWN